MGDLSRLGLIGALGHAGEGLEHLYEATGGIFVKIDERVDLTDMERAALTVIEKAFRQVMDEVGDAYLWAVEMRDVEELISQVAAYDLEFKTSIDAKDRLKSALRKQRKSGG